MSKPQETKLKLKNRPRCTAVRGCLGRAFILSFRLGRGRTVRICSMHYGRFRRTGGLDSAVRYGAMASPRASRDKRVREEFQSRFSSLSGASMRAEPWGPGSTKVTDKDGSVEQLSTNRLWAFQRRGWISIGPWNARGSRSVRLTKAGDALIREGSSEDG